jgi:hypothetical protein
VVEKTLWRRRWTSLHEYNFALRKKFETDNLTNANLSDSKNIKILPGW